MRHHCQQLSPKNIRHCSTILAVATSLASLDPLSPSAYPSRILSRPAAPPLSVPAPLSAPSIYGDFVRHAYSSIFRARPSSTPLGMAEPNIVGVVLLTQVGCAWVDGHPATGVVVASPTCGSLGGGAVMYIDGFAVVLTWPGRQRRRAAWRGRCGCERIDGAATVVSLPLVEHAFMTGERAPIPQDL